MGLWRNILRNRTKVRSGRVSSLAIAILTASLLMGQTAVLADEVVEVPETEEQSEVIAEDTRETEEVQMSAGAAEEMPRLKAATVVSLPYEVNIGDEGMDGYDNTKQGFCYDNDTKTLILENVDIHAARGFKLKNLGSTELTIFFIGECKLSTDNEGPVLGVTGSAGGKTRLIGADKLSKMTINGGTAYDAIGDKVKLEYVSGLVNIGKFAIPDSDAQLYMASDAVNNSVKVTKSNGGEITYTGAFPIKSDTFKTGGADSSDINGVDITPTSELADTGYKVELTDADGLIEDGKIKLNIDGKCQLKAAITGTTNQDVVYMSSNPEVAKVDPHTGEVIGVAKGTATITARSCADLRKKASVEVDVNKYYKYTFKSNLPDVPDKVFEVVDGTKFKIPGDEEVVSWNDAFKKKLEDYKLVNWGYKYSYYSSNAEPGKIVEAGKDEPYNADTEFTANWAKYVTVTFTKDLRKTDKSVISFNKVYYKGQRLDLQKVEDMYPEILTDDSDPYKNFYLTKFLGWYDSLTKGVYDPSVGGYGYDGSPGYTDKKVNVPGTEGETYVLNRVYDISTSETYDTVNFFGLWDIPEDDPIYSDPTDPTPTPDPSDPSDPTPTPSPTDPTNPTTPSGNNSTTPSANTHVRAENTCVKGEKVNLASMVFSGVTGISKYKIDSGGSGKGSVNGKGIFKGKKPGTVIVIAQDSSGKELAAVVMTVLNKPKLKFSGTYAIGQTFDAYDCFTTDDTKTTAADEWASSKTSVATVDQKTGMITIVGKGKTKITAKFGNVKVKAKLKVK
ncbi:MAG: Ig-like domain-containing protein [Lachnospiraceae bacterium]|nr:Ig-like domain-containing protein [Lachnospiraceae bacterium]